MKIIYYFCKVYVTISQYKRNRTIHLTLTINF